MVLVSRSYIHTRLHGKRAVERYTADTHPTTGLQSYTAYTALYSVVYYTAIQLIHYTALYNHPLVNKARKQGSYC